MSVGFPVDKNTVDQRLGSIAWQLRSTFEQVALIKAWLDGKSDAELTALGYNAADIALARNSYGDLDNLRKVALGQQATGASNFFANAGKLTGAQ